MYTNNYEINYKKKSSKKNISIIERLIMVASGGYLVYNGLYKNKKSISQTSTGALILLRGINGYCPIYNMVDELKEEADKTIYIRVKQIINKPISEVYNFWRNIENLPKFMDHLKSVKEITNSKSEWAATGPAGIGNITWTAEISKEITNSIIVWESLSDASISNTGQVKFISKGNNSTEVEIIITYKAPLGTAGEHAVQFINPYFRSLVKKDVEGFKNFIESLKDMKEIKDT